jgi:hypothetical protein
VAGPTRAAPRKATFCDLHHRLLLNALITCRLATAPSLNPPPIRCGRQEPRLRTRRRGSVSPGHVLCGAPNTLQRFFCDSLASHNSLFAEPCNTFQKSSDSSYTISHFGCECS